MIKYKSRSGPDMGWSVLCLKVERLSFLPVLMRQAQYRCQLDETLLRNCIAAPTRSCAFIWFHPHEVFSTDVDVF